MSESLCGRFWETAMARHDGKRAPAQVCCTYPETAQQRSWTPDSAAPKPVQSRRPPPQADIYSQERAAIIERLETGLHPHAPWRDPREPWAPGQPKADPVPFAHTLAGACVWLRHRQTGRHDVSAELLWCLVVRENCEAEAEAVCAALVSAWLDMHASIATLAKTPAGLSCVERAAAKLVKLCITGHDARGKLPVQWKQWCMLRESGERMLWGLADRAARRAAEALR